MAAKAKPKKKTKAACGKRLTARQWEDIRTFYEQGETIQNLASDFGCSEVTVWAVVRGERKRPTPGKQEDTRCYLPTRAEIDAGCLLAQAARESAARRTAGAHARPTQLVCEYEPPVYSIRSNRRPSTVGRYH